MGQARCCNEGWLKEYWFSQSYMNGNEAFLSLLYSHEVCRTFHMHSEFQNQILNRWDYSHHRVIK